MVEIGGAVAPKGNLKLVPNLNILPNIFLTGSQILQRWRVEFDEELDIDFDFLLSPKSPVSLRLVDL